MTLTCITPNHREARSSDPTDTIRPPVNFPLEWGYVAAANPSARIIDAYSRDITAVEVAQEAVRDSGGGVVLISTTPSYLFWRCPPLDVQIVEDYAQALRATGADLEILAVGPHGTTEPLWVLETCPSVDGVVRGEIDSALDTDGLPRRSFISTRRTVGTSAPQRQLGACRQIGVHTDSVPHAWMSVPALSDFAGRAALVETSRGCPFNCPFCYRDGFRGVLRLKDLDVLAVELDELVQDGVKYVFLIDETFGVPWPHAEAVMNALHSRGLLWGMQTRPELWIRRSRRQALVESGCVYAEVGIEALELVGLKALEKFADESAALEGARLLQADLSAVGLNSLDVGNPDLDLMTPRAAGRLRDMEGLRPPAFIPYPGTPWGYRALQSLGLGTGFADAAKAYRLYKLMERHRLAAAVLRRSRTLRRASVDVLAFLSRLHDSRGARATRYERVIAGRRGIVDNPPRPMPRPSS
jgi:radical SAM superfamily enzyme YgiQ (UPF0313 family)